jgi:hypothetical protein
MSISSLTKRMLLVVAVLSAICVTGCNTTKTASTGTNDTSIAPSERGKASNYNRTDAGKKPEKATKGDK